MIKTYHKTATIKAEQFDGSREMAKRYGELLLRIGDWIATEENGEHWPIDNEIFQKTYMELPAIPKGVAEYIESAKQDEEVTNVIIAAMGAIEFDQSNIVVSEWIQDNGDDFAQAWLTGYTTMEG
ncbi:hypothetical protein [Levilactobacillus phage ENFP1]|nr:hypothetical protein [Levilactobacillus phage ENFP1]